MTDPTTPQHTPPGWYADPSGVPQRQRWWDGTQWNEATQPTPNAAPFGSTVPYSYNAPALADRSSANPNTPQVWAIALTPLLVFVELAVLFSMGAMTMDLISDASADLTAVDAADGITRGAGYLLVVILAIFDSRELARRGVEKPFHWAYAFLGIVYIIGRTVVVRRRTGRGLAPLFVWIGGVLLSWTIPVVIGVIMGLMYAGSLA